MESSPSPSDRTVEIRNQGSGNERKSKLNGNSAMDEEIIRLRENTTFNETLILEKVLSRILGVEFSRPLLLELSDGILLCRLFKVLMPNRIIKEPNESKNLSLFMKLDNLSIFTNACRSIHIPEGLLISQSYFADGDNHLLVSGLLIFLLWVLNQSITDESSKVTRHHLINQVEKDGIDSCINLLTSQLCPIDTVIVSKQASPKQLHHEQKDDWMKRHAVEPLNPIFDGDKRQDYIRNRMGKFLVSVAERAKIRPVSATSLLQVEESNLIAIATGDGDVVSYLEEDEKESTVVMMINDQSRTDKNTVKKPTNKSFDNTDRNRYSDSCLHENKRREISNRPSLGIQSVTVGTTVEVSGRRLSNRSTRLSYDHVQSTVKQFREVPVVRKVVQYVEKVGPQRIVAGAICQPRYLQGLDQDGNVIVPYIQIRSVPKYIASVANRNRVKLNDAAMEEEEPVVARRGLTFDEPIEEPVGDEVIVREALLEYDGENSIDIIEHRFDKSIRDSYLSKDM